MRRVQQRGENLRQIAMPCDFVQRSTFYFDVFNFRPLWSISRVLSLFIDNSSNSKEVAVTIFHSGQVIIAQPKTQGYYPVLSYSDSFAMSISSMGSSDTATVYACNYMVPPGSWGPNQTQPISGTVSVDNFPSGFNVNNFPPFFAEASIATVFHTVSSGYQELVAVKTGYYLIIYSISVVMHADSYDSSGGSKNMNIQILDSNLNDIFDNIFQVPGVSASISNVTAPPTSQTPAGFIYSSNNVGFGYNVGYSGSNFNGAVNIAVSYRFSLTQP